MHRIQLNMYRYFRLIVMLDQSIFYLKEYVDYRNASGWEANVEPEEEKKRYC